MTCVSVEDDKLNNKICDPMSLEELTARMEAAAEEKKEELEVELFEKPTLIIRYGGFVN
jgi:hypothetical protein